MGQKAFREPLYDEPTLTERIYVSFLTGVIVALCFWLIENFFV